MKDRVGCCDAFHLATLVSPQASALRSRQQVFFSFLYLLFLLLLFFFSSFFHHSSACRAYRLVCSQLRWQPRRQNFPAISVRFRCEIKIYSCSTRVRSSVGKMMTGSNASAMDEKMQKAVQRIVPVLAASKYKGQDGRIGIFGGSAEYTGAPYFAAMSALRTGADIVHIFCSKDAGIAIKSQSPEPIVHPILDQHDAMRHIKPWLERLHVILVGPGLGRDDKILKTIAELVNVCKELKKPMIVDADGLYLLSQKPDLVKDYPGLILTPNAMEFSRLAKAFLEKSIQPAPVVRISDVKHLADFIGKNVVVLHKGAKDVIVDGHKGTEAVSCSLAGSGRRCGGQGDVLAGALSVFWWWSMNAGPSECALSPAVIAAYGASRLTRECNASAFKVKQRGTLTSDMLEQVQPVFARLFEAPGNKPSSFTGIRSRTRSTDSSNLPSRINQ